MTGPIKIVVAGGGVAGLEALLALGDIAGDRVDLTLVEPAGEFVFRPMAVTEPFGRGHAQRRSMDDVAREVGAARVPSALVAVDAGARTIATADDRELSYDALLVAVGAASRAAYRRVITWTPESDADVFGGLLRDLEEGYTKQIAFVVPPGAAWPLPAYELAFMTAWQARSMGQNDLEITVYTPENAPLGIFGAQAAAALRDDLHEARITVRTGAFVQQERDGSLVVQPGGRSLAGTRVVALPVAESRAPRGLPVDPAGFIRCDLHGAVPGAERVWAAGDATAFPVKQGGLAAQQADAAAEAIAALAGADVRPQPFRPVLRGVVLTGRGRNWMRRDLQGTTEDVAAEEHDGERHALWWPPTKVAGRYLSPYLAGLEEQRLDEQAPEGHVVMVDVGREVPAAADALRLAELRDRG